MIFWRIIFILFHGIARKIHEQRNTFVSNVGKRNSEVSWRYEGTRCKECEASVEELAVMLAYAAFSSQLKFRALPE
jgi:hypothetical protein